MNQNYLIFLSNKIDVKSYKNSIQSTLVLVILLTYKSFLHIHFIAYPQTSLLLEFQGSFIILSYIRTLLNIKSNKGKITYKGTSIRLSADFLTETLQARREWHDIFKVMKGKNLQPRILYPASLSFRFDGEIKSFPDKQKLREFSTTKPVLQQMLKEFLQARNKEKTYKK